MVDSEMSKGGMNDVSGSMTYSEGHRITSIPPESAFSHRYWLVGSRDNGAYAAYPIGNPSHQKT